MGIVSKVKFLINSIYNKALIHYAGNLECGYGVIINGRLKVLNSRTGAIFLGNNVRINSGKDYNIIGGDTRTNLVIVEDGRIIIGDDTGISNSTLVAQTEINIGDNVKIGGSVKIYDTDFHSVKYMNRMEAIDSDIRTEKIVIKKGAFIGAHSIILKGVTIGRNAVIGAGSVVTKNVPDNELWAGNPAAFIKKVDNNL